MSDHESGRVREWGTLTGIPVLYVGTLLVVLAAGGSLGFAAAAALLPRSWADRSSGSFGRSPGWSTTTRPT